MHEENDHNDLQSIITHALEEMEQDLGTKLDPDHVNLAELSRRTHLSRGKLRRLQKHGFVVVPHGLKGTTAVRTVLSGYTGTVDHLFFGISVREKAQDRFDMREMVNEAEKNMYSVKREFYGRPENNRRGRS